MRKAACLILSFLSLSAWASPTLYGPWTGAPLSDSITVSWGAEAPLPATLEYSLLAFYLSGGGFTQSLSYEPENGDPGVFSLRVERLAPATWYVYRLCFSQGSCSPLGTFRTAPVPGEPVTFGVISDTQWQWTGQNRVEMVAQAMALDPWAFHFVLHAGDLVETPIPSHWEFFFRSTEPILRRAPIIPVLGNHERGSSTYYQHFALPPGGGRMGERWWALHWGDVVVVGLDSNARTPKDYQDQIDFLRQELQGPEPHKFVVFHHPVFSSDASHGGTEGLQKLWHPVFVELGVDLVLNGHAHNYERIERDGVVYLVVGGGGANPSPLSPERVEGSMVGWSDRYFYVAIRADDTGITVRVQGVAQLQDGQISPAPEILDTFFLPLD